MSIVLMSIVLATAWSFGCASQSASKPDGGAGNGGAGGIAAPGAGGAAGGAFDGGADASISAAGGATGAGGAGGHMDGGGMGGASTTDAGAGDLGTGGSGMGGSGMGGSGMGGAGQGGLGSACTGMGGAGMGGSGMGGSQVDAGAGGTFPTAQVGTTVVTGANPPMLATVHISQIGQNIHIELDGSGFGPAPGGLPAVTTLLQFQITDITQGGWTAGRTNVSGVSLQYTNWTDTKIVIDGFGPQYGSNNTRMLPGDQVSIFVQSTTAGAGSTTWTGTIQNEAPLPPDPSGPTPRVVSVSFSNIGQNMHIEVAGSGFGTAPIGLPAVTTVGGFQITDITQGNWSAGRTNISGVGLQFTTWTDGLIVIDGFGPQYDNTGANKVAVNDAVSIYVQNSGGPEFEIWTGTLQEGTSPAPDPNGPTPRVSCVSFSNIGQNMHIEITGTGFSTAPIGLPAVTTVSVFQFADITQGGWTAGRTNVSGVGLQFTTWTDGLIVIDGFGPQYGGVNKVAVNDAVSIYVQNAHGPEFMVWTGTLQPSLPPGPDPLGPTPRVASVTFSQVGATMQIEVDGSGFGSQPIGLPATTTVNQFQFTDITQGGWTAGRTNVSPVALQYTSWTDSKIVISGFGMQYAVNPTNKVVSGDAVSLYVQNSAGPEFIVWTDTLP